MHCLFCENQLDGSDEHVILNAIGGRKSSRNILCSRCNNDFGNTIDKALLDALEPFTLILNPPTRRQSIAARKRILDTKGIEYEMGAGGELKVRYKQIAPTQWIADASDAERVMENVQSAAAAIEKRTGEKATVSTSTGSEIPQGITFRLALDNVIALRAMAKWAFDLLGMEVLTTDALRAEVPVVEKAFIHDGAPLPLAGYLERSLLPQMFEGLEHFVLLMQSPNGSIYWEASAYGGAIAVAGRTAPIHHRFKAIMYRVDPVTGNHSMEHPRGVVNDDTCMWVSTYDSTCKQRTETASARMNQLMNARQGVARITQECMDEHLPKSGVITQEHINLLSRCVAEKYVALMQQINAFDNLDE